VRATPSPPARCHDGPVTDRSASSERLTYHVEMALPRTALAVCDALDATLHRSDRHIGVITGAREGGLYLGILTGAENEDAARSRALRLVTAALETLGRGELSPHVQVRDVTGRRALPGGPHRVDGLPPLPYRTTALPDGRVLMATCDDPLGEWFAFVKDGPENVMAGRSLPEVLGELFELPWGKKAPWFYDAIEQLAGHPTTDGVRFPCPCCDHLTLDEPPPGTDATCEVCRWEDDRVQFRDPDYPGGANRVSLREGRDNFGRYGKSDADRRGPTRPPRPDEKPPVS
jgi:cysteine-rich CPCC protein